MDFTESARRALSYARRIAKKMGQNYVGTEHLLIGLLQEKDSIAAHVLNNENITKEDIIQLISKLIAPESGTQVMERDGYTSKLQMVLERAETEARLSHADEIGTEHLLLALIRIRARSRCSVPISSAWLSRASVSALSKTIWSLEV